MKAVMIEVHFPVERETEKAYLCTIQSNWARHDRTIWIPKSICTARVLEDRYDKNGHLVVNGGTSVIEVADWFLRKNRIRA